MVLKKIMVLHDDGDVVKAAAPAAASEEEERPCSSFASSEGKQAPA